MPGATAGREGGTCLLQLLARSRNHAGIPLHAAQCPSVIAPELEKAIPAGRFGTAEEFGQLFAYICSAQASYITGQNFLIDGGAYLGMF